MRPRIATVALAFLVYAALSCSALEGPGSPVTLLVTNGTCAVSGLMCDSLEILGFPSNQPNTPGGLWSVDLGPLTGRQACLKIPLSASFYIINADTHDTTTIGWTQMFPLSVGALRPPDSRIMAGPDTRAFVPGRARGWRVTLPNDSTVLAAEPCTP